MARYHNQPAIPTISKHVVNIVHEAFSFMQSDFCENNLKEAPAQYWRHVKVQSHRRCGFSTTALKLLNEYTSSLIVTHSYPAANMLRQLAIDNRLVPKSCGEDFYNNITFTDHVTPFGLMSHRWFARRRPEERYQLIILDGASMIENQMNNEFSGGMSQFENMDEFRMSLWQVCDLLVELG